MNATRAGTLIAALAVIAATRGALAAPAAALAPRFTPAAAESGAPAPPDTSLQHYFGGMADSTDSFFGKTAAPLDTAGLDSARIAALALPPGKAEKRRMGWGFGYGPVFRFNRVDGGVFGGSAGFRVPYGLGRLSGHLAYATGPKIGLGGATWRKFWGDEEEERYGWLTARVENETQVMDRIRPISADDVFNTAQALTTGNDVREFLRRNEWSVAGTLARPMWHVVGGWRDALESPLDATTKWTLFGGEPRRFDNLNATHGRAREALMGARVRAPRLPVTAVADYRVARRALGSDFEYRVTRLAAGANIGVRRWYALVPQAMMGRLTGDPLPQESFFLDRSGALTTEFFNRIGGTHVAVGRVDFISTRDVLEQLHIPHPAMFPMQVDVFSAAGAAWGADPYGGPPQPGGTWPDGQWKSEVGAALAYQPGFPDLTTLMRFAVAWPLQGGAGRGVFTLSITRALFLLELPSR